MPRTKTKTTTGPEATESTFQRHPKDTGSPEVQISILSKEINNLQKHISIHTHDYDAKRSLLKKVARRRRLLKYLKENNIDAYTTISKAFDIKV